MNDLFRDDDDSDGGEFELQAEERNVELPAGVTVRVRETRCQCRRRVDLTTTD